MKRRPLIAAVAFLLLAACGQEGSILPGSATSERKPPAPTRAAAPEDQASPGPTDPAATATPEAAEPGGEGTPEERPAEPSQPVEEGGVTPPRDGTYVYSYRGESTDPFNPTPRRFDGELMSEISHQGNVYTEEQTNTETPGRFTTRTRWEASRVLLLSFRSQTAGGDFGCTFDPPLVVMNLPIRPGRIPTQEFKGQGNACLGKLDINVVGRENTTDANGRSWSTWRVEIRIEAGNEQFTSVTDDTQWLSPELGVEVRSDGTTRGEIRGAGGSQSFDGKATAVLKRHP